jgi:membrane protein DedA with SNARE-associated domain
MTVAIFAMQAAAVQAVDLGIYLILFLGVGASWIGIPIVGGAVLAAAGALAGDDQLDVWVVVAVAAVASWSGGYVGYLLGRRAGDALAGRPGRWRRQRQRAVEIGERFYSRWGPLAVFLTPTWVSGALGMSRSSFLAWNAVAAVLSSLVAVFGAYAVASAVLGRLSTGGLVALVAGLVAAAAAGIALQRRRGRIRRSEGPAGRSAS